MTLLRRTEHTAFAVAVREERLYITSLFKSNHIASLTKHQRPSAASLSELRSRNISFSFYYQSRISD